MKKNLTTSQIEYVKEWIDEQDYMDFVENGEGREYEIDMEEDGLINIMTVKPNFFYTPGEMHLSWDTGWEIDREDEFNMSSVEVTVDVYTTDGDDVDSMEGEIIY